MSDLMPHKLCSCQLGQCSGYLCECRPRRSLISALIDISASRDVPLRSLGMDAEVIVLSERRRRA